MSRRILSQIQRSNKKRVNKPLGLGIVMDVVLDGDSEAIKSLQNPAEGKADKNFSLIGAAKIRKLDDTSSSTDNLRYYRPEDYSFIDLPIIGEIVQLMTNETGGVVYKRIISPNLKYTLQSGILQYNK